MKKKSTATAQLPLGLSYESNSNESKDSIQISLSILLQRLERSFLINKEYLDAKTHKEIFAELRAKDINEELETLIGINEETIIHDYLYHKVFYKAKEDGMFSVKSTDKNCLGEYVYNPLEFDMVRFLRRIVRRLKRAANKENYQQQIPKAIFELIAFAFANNINPLNEI